MQRPIPARLALGFLVLMSAASHAAAPTPPADAPAGQAAPAAPAAPAAAPAATVDSEAIDLLFETPWLARVAPGTTLTYDISAQNTDAARFGQPFADTVRLRVLQGSAGPQARDAFLDIYSGPRERNLGPMPDTAGNPALMVLLEQDTFDLFRTVGGQPAYFRNRVRAALRDGARVEDVTVSVAGKDAPGRRVTIEPFAQDGNFERLPDLRRTAYAVVVSEAVPGGIQSVTATVPGEGNAAPLKRKAMVLQGTSVR